MQFTLNMTADERERLAYLAGHTDVAAAYAEAGGLEAATEAAGDAQGYVQEARGSFMPEDFLSEEFKELQNAIGAMRKNNASRDVLQDLLNRMEAKRDEQARESEFGLDQLRQADAALEP